MGETSKTFLLIHDVESEEALHSLPPVMVLIGWVLRDVCERW